MQLTQGMFGTPFNSKRGPFGLRSGQRRFFSDILAKNCGWYNRRREKLGQGDLCADDLKQISSGLEKGEVFITLPARFSGEDAPGVDYVASNATFVITKGKMYHVGPLGPNVFLADYLRRLRGLALEVIMPARVRALMTG